MKVYHLKREITVPRPREEVFAFFEGPENLSILTPQSMQFTILTPQPIKMQSGAIIDYSVKIMGFRRHWQTLITEYNPPDRFVDIQLKGPYTFWHHTHRFVDRGSKTTIIDEVKYVVPFGIIGRIINAVVIRRQLDSIFDFRAQIIAREFGDVRDNELYSMVRSK